MIDGVVDFPFDILGVRDGEDLVGVPFLFLSGESGDGVEKVAGGLDGGTPRIGVDLPGEAVKGG